MANQVIILYRTFIFQIQLTAIQSMLEQKRIGFLRKSCEIARKEIKGQIIFEAEGNRVNSNPAAKTFLYRDIHRLVWESTINF